MWWSDPEQVKWMVRAYHIAFFIFVSEYQQFSSKNYELDLGFARWMIHLANEQETPVEEKDFEKQLEQVESGMVQEFLSQVKNVGDFELHKVFLTHLFAGNDEYNG